MSFCIKEGFIFQNLTPQSSMSLREKSNFEIRNRPTWSFVTSHSSHQHQSYKVLQPRYPSWFQGGKAEIGEVNDKRMQQDLEKGKVYRSVASVDVTYTHTVNDLFHADTRWTSLAIDRRSVNISWNENLLNRPVSTCRWLKSKTPQSVNPALM